VDEVSQFSRVSQDIDRLLGLGCIPFQVLTSLQIDWNSQYLVLVQCMRKAPALFTHYFEG
jgi:hypothetical protein